MRILFIFPRPTPYDSRSVREKPSGGTEKTVIFLGEALQKLGHEVTWITTPEQLREYQGNPDAVITQVAELLESFPNAKRIFWAHHFSDQPVIQQNAAFGRCFADRIVTLSECHHRDFKDNLRLDSITIGHGVWHDELDPSVKAGGHQERGDNPGGRSGLGIGGSHPGKDPYRLIYASTPFRGLERIPKLFTEIKAREPRATIAICSSMGTYGEPEKDAQYQKIFDELAETPGVELKGSLNQAQLYAEYSRASIFFYPSIWPETYCLALDEAIAHGCLPLVNPLGALSERALAVTEVNTSNTISFFERGEKGRYRDNGGLHAVRHHPQDWLQIAKQWEAEVLNDGA